MGLLDPAMWSREDRRAVLELGKDGFDHSSTSATASHAMVVGSTGPFANLAGQRALEAGGSAVDAAITTALAQIVLAAGGRGSASLGCSAWCMSMPRVARSVR